MREVLCEFSMFPIGEGVSVSAYVAKALAIVKESGLTYSLSSMGTCIEGTYDEVSAVIGKCLAAMKEDADRVYSVIKIDYKKGRENAMETKVASVERKLDSKS